MPSRAQGRRCQQLRYPGHQGSGLDSAGELVLISSVSCDSYLCSYISFSSLYFQVFALGLLFSFFQSIGIGYKRAHPACQISVQGFAPRPCLQIKTSGSSQAFRRYGFVDAVQELDPVGTLGLLDQDYQVFSFLLCLLVFISWSIFMCRVFGALCPIVYLHFFRSLTE